MAVELIAFGGDKRMDGLLGAARKAGFGCRHVKGEEELRTLGAQTDVIVLPWPKWKSGAQVTGSEMDAKEVLETLPSCAMLMGGGVEERDFPHVKQVFDPSQDEALLTLNAKLTAEGALAMLLQSPDGAMIGKTCVITGFGRIARALAVRLAAMEVFVIVCARNEQQMLLAHRMGAHPVPLDKLTQAAAQADIVLNTVPARIFGSDALAQMKPGVRYIELASAPYGADPELAAHLGVGMEIMGGIPGKYAPLQAGEALFGAMMRALTQSGMKEDA